MIIRNGNLWPYKRSYQNQRGGPGKNRRGENRELPAGGVNQTEKFIRGILNSEAQGYHPLAWERKSLVQSPLFILAICNICAEFEPYVSFGSMSITA